MLGARTSNRSVATRGQSVVARRKIRPEVLFLHIGWAREYRGAPGDLPQGKFGYIKDGNEDMGDALNFRDYRGRCFGYAPHRMIDLGGWAPPRIPTT
jgi:hypothetical protein